MDRVTGWIWGSGSKEDTKLKPNSGVDNQPNLNKPGSNDNVVGAKISTQQTTDFKSEPSLQKTKSVNTGGTHWYSGVTGLFWGSGTKDEVQLKPSGPLPEMNKSTNNNVEVTEYSTQQPNVKSEPLKPVLVDTDVSLWRKMGHMTGWILGSDSKKDDKMASNNNVGNQHMSDKSSNTSVQSTKTSVQINVKSEATPMKPVSVDSSNTHWYSGLTGWIWGSRSTEDQSIRDKTTCITSDSIESTEPLESEVNSDRLHVKPVLVDDDISVSYRRRISASLQTYSEDINKTIEPWLRENTHLQPEDKVYKKLVATFGATMLYIMLLRKTVKQWKLNKNQRHTVLISKMAALGMYVSYLHGEWYVAVTEPPSDKPRTFFGKLIKDFQTSFGPSK